MTYKACIDDIFAKTGKTHSSSPPPAIGQPVPGPTDQPASSHHPMAITPF
jgi:hypothetical protein